MSPVDQQPGDQQPGDQQPGDQQPGDRWRILAELLRRQRRGILLGVGVGLLWTAGKVAVPQLTRLAIDRGIERGGSVVGWALLIAAAGLVTGTFTAARRYFAF
ncbi:MAG: hypothetical protein WD225_04530, partial [Ilumatobacteraceae bacterium]